MAKVEMSLQEYDALREELTRYKNIVRAMTVPVIDSWSLDYWKEDTSRTLSVYSNYQHSLSDKDLEFLKNEIHMNMNNLGFENVDISVDLHTLYIGDIRHKVEVAVESAE